MQERNRPRPTPEDVFGLTDNERLWDTVSDARFRGIVDDDDTEVRCVEVSSNSYGEFLFVTVSRGSDESRALITFFGLGLHEYRERWLTAEWRWYRTDYFPELHEQVVAKDELDDLLRQRREAIAGSMVPGERSGRAKLFEMIADLTDDDGAIAEMEDLGDLADFLDDLDE